MPLTRPFAALALVALTAPATFAGPSWSTPSGSSDTVTYSNGQTQNGLFTPDSPLVMNDTFVFNPSNFSVQDNGTITDVASALITAKSGRTLSGFSAYLAGDFSTLGLAIARADGTLTLTNPTTHAVVSRPFDFGTAFNAEDGIFSDKVAITLPAGWKSAQVDLSAGVQAGTVPGSTSFVQIKAASFDAETKVAAVPLPPAALAAIPGIAVAYFARRRRICA